MAKKTSKKKAKQDAPEERQVAMAVAAHPDDIEFMMAGTLLLLADAGWEIHYMNLSNGNCGTATQSRSAIEKRRRKEAKNACKTAGAVFHPPVCDDLEIFHTPETVGAVCSVIRTVRPRILLTSSPEDYMEDHMNASRVVVTAAFARGMRNYPVSPKRKPVDDPCTIYHALPYGLCDGLRRRIRAGQYVDVSSVMQRKIEMLVCHESQKEWLDVSQGLDAYQKTLEEMCMQVGSMSKKYTYAEGWRRHSHLGFTATDTDPLTSVLRGKVIIDREYERGLIE